jgi:hypothetical protein
MNQPIWRDEARRANAGRERKKRTQEENARRERKKSATSIEPNRPQGTPSKDEKGRQSRMRYVRQLMASQGYEPTISALRSVREIERLSESVEEDMWQEGLSP